MKAKELKRLGRSDLLEMLLELSLENDRMRQELETLRAKTQQRAIDLEESGSLAEAALKLNDVFRAAQAACEQYKENIQSRSHSADAIFHEKEAQAQAMVAETQKHCEAMLEEARIQAREILEEARKASQESQPEEPKPSKCCKHTHKRKPKKQDKRR